MLRFRHSILSASADEGRHLAVARYSSQTSTSVTKATASCHGIAAVNRCATQKQFGIKDSFHNGNVPCFSGELLRTQKQLLENRRTVVAMES